MRRGRSGRSRASAARASAVAVLASLAVLALPLGLAAAHAASNPPRVVIILLDTNSSPTTSRLPMERHAAMTYALALPADVEVGLITFNDGWRTVLAPTASRRRLAAAVAAVQPAGATSNGIRDALVGAVADINRIGALRRSRLLVLSNGESLHHPVRVAVIPTDVVTWYDDSDDYPGKVRHLAAASGGHVASPAHVAALAAAFPALPKPEVHPTATRSPSHAAQPSALSGRPSASLFAVLACVFAALLVLALMAIGSLRPGNRRPHLAGQIERYGPLSTPAVVPEGDGKVARTAVGLMTRVLRSRDTEPKLAARLDHAGIQRQPAEWALLGVCVSVALAAAVTALTANAVLGIPLGVLVGWLGMRLALNLKIRRRKAAFDEQLPNVLQLVAGSLQTGFSLSQAIDAVVREESQPAAGEFARALTDTRLGVDLDIALDGVADRMESTDLRWVVMAIRIQRETGGNLAEVLRNTVATMRERAYLRRQVRSLSAEGRLSAYILLALPAFVGSWLLYSSPNYMRPLYTTAFGVLLLVIAAVLVVLGAFWMRKLINVEV
jgi:Flp pilus assembly protein TadB